MGEQLVAENNGVENVSEAVPDANPRWIGHQNIEQLVKRSQLKRSKIRPLGSDLSALENILDPNIYDDNDFYIEMLKEMDDVENDDLKDTRNLLLKRKLMREDKQLTQKNVDRRASKSRKLRFDVHDKIVNFMVGKS